MQRGRGSRGRRVWPRGGNSNWQGGPQGGGMMERGGGPMGTMGTMGPMGGGMGGPMGPGWGPDEVMAGAGMGGPDMMQGPGMMGGGGPGMMGASGMMAAGGPGMMAAGGPGMMAAGGPSMMSAPMEPRGGMMPPPFGFGDMGPPMAKRMRPMDDMPAGGRGQGHLPGPPGAAGQLQQQQSNQQQQQQQKAPGWGVTIANDYCQNFVDTGERPQNYLMDANVADPLAEYPVQKRLHEAKKAQLASFMTPPYAIRADLKRLQLSQVTFGTRFDVILIDPPWEEYVRRAPGFVAKDEEVWTWEQIRNLDIGAIADNPSFVFLWCGCEEGLDAGRHCFTQWGFRRIEDICWIKSNKDKNRKYLSAQHQDPRSTLVHTKEHCLVGMKGKLIRGHDHVFVHANCDTDVICTEEPQLGSTRKPEELYNIIERFCNGRRRLELFGQDHNIRPGWVTVGKNISQTNFRVQAYLEHFKDNRGIPYTSHGGYTPAKDAPVVVPTTEDIEQTRPRSPGR